MTTSDRIRVLVADDHPLIREGMVALIQVEGIDVVGLAANGREAVDLCRSLAPDVVVMDLEMPEMDGFAATRAIKQEYPQTAVLIFTSHGSPEFLSAGLDAGASGYMLKERAPAVLVGAIRMVRDGESVVPPELLAKALAGLARPQDPSPSERPASELDQLSSLESQVLKFVVEGLTNGEIAEQLHYSVGTIKNAVQRVIEKLGVSDRTQAAVYAVKSGYLS